MASIAKNTPQHIEFVNISQPDRPTLLVQAGDWELKDNKSEVGVVFDVFGEQPPILSSDDARKLAKWLERAAALLDGKKPDKRHKSKHRNEDDDEEYYDWRP